MDKVSYKYPDFQKLENPKKMLDDESLLKRTGSHIDTSRSANERNQQY